MSLTTGTTIYRAETYLDGDTTVYNHHATLEGAKHYLSLRVAEMEADLEWDEHGGGMYWSVFGTSHAGERLGLFIWADELYK